MLKLNPSTLLTRDDLLGYDISFSFESSEMMGVFEGLSFRLIDGKFVESLVTISGVEYHACTISKVTVFTDGDEVDIDER